MYNVWKNIKLLIILRRWEKLCVAVRNKKTDNDTKEVKEVKHSCSNSERVTSIKVDNIDELEIYDVANYVFIGKTTVIIKSDEIQYVQRFES